MSTQRIIQESINKNPLGLKEALEEELRARVAEAISAKMEEVEEIEEITKTAIKRPESYVGSDGHTHTRLAPVKRVEKDYSGQDKIKEN